MKPNHGWEDNRIEKHRMGQLGFDPPVSKQRPYASSYGDSNKPPGSIKRCDLLPS